VSDVRSKVMITSCSTSRPHAGNQDRQAWVFVSLRSFLWVVTVSLSVYGRDKRSVETYGQGLSVSLPAGELEVVQAVQDVVGDGIIQGSKEYNKDEYISGAEAADSTAVFPQWIGDGKVFYKVRKNALDPRNFKDSGDSGTLAVRYVVQHGDDRNTRLKIDAVFVDDFHRQSHASNGCVETAEYKDIQDHIAAEQLKKSSSTKLTQESHQFVANDLAGKRQQPPQAAPIPDESLEQHVDRLRHELERVVKPEGARLRSAPFRSASSLKSLPPGSQVVILISTPYWLGVETETGEHGWIHHSELGPLP
jgi:hypothetical protein